MSLSSTVNIEVALFNERVLSWEPLIEPTIDTAGKSFSTWGLTCSIIPVSIEVTKLADQAAIETHINLGTSLLSERQLT
jgi:hypothetical protein